MMGYNINNYKMNMKKNKQHIISILFILIMLIIALSTSKGPVDASLKIINNSSYNLKFNILGNDRDQDGNRREFEEKFTLNIGQEKTINIIGHNSPHPFMYIHEIFIYNENDELIKGFRSYDENYESVSTINLKKNVWIITDGEY
jgi:hypothetical protein